MLVRDKTVLLGVLQALGAVVGYVVDVGMCVEAVGEGGVVLRLSLATLWS